jgi:1,4-dihydroxy-2-naphthoate octaprenyltransferase
MGSIVSCLALNLCECAACMACSCCTSMINASLAQAARFGHFLILITIFTVAIILGQKYPNDINNYNDYTEVNLTDRCDGNYLENCIYNQLIYRASFALFILFMFLMFVTAISEYANRSFWIIKFGIAIGIFIGFWWSDNTFFIGYAEFARVISFFWLLIQGLLLIDFSHDAHDLLMGNKGGNSEDNSPSYGQYLTFSFIGLFLALLGLVYLFLDFTDCDLGMFFTILTLIMGLITTLVSLTDHVNKGLLTPCICFAYSVFICW